MAKKSIHPETFDAVFADVSTGRQFKTTTTIKSKETVTLDGLQYFRFLRDVTSDSHPAYTGQKRFVDTAGRVQLFESKFKRRRG